MDLLSNILSCLKLKGTLYFRTSFTSPWSIRVPAFEHVARFHLAHRGRCLVRVDPREKPVQLEQGDLLIITRGAAHTLYCDPSTEHQPTLLDQVIEQSGFTGHGTLVYGEPGTHHETQLVCGHFAFASEASHPLLEALPEHIHIRNFGEDAGTWMAETLRVIGAEAGSRNMGSDLISLKLSEIIYAQALRTYLNSPQARRSGLAGYSDPRIARTLEAIHADPGHTWNLEELADIAGVSRTVFISTFTSLMDITPMQYITLWRMQIARQKLMDSRSPIIKIAEATGYQSEAAFGRVFKKHFQMPPATFRRLNQIC